MYGEKFMVSLVRRIGHIVKHGPEIIKNNIVINRLKRHNHFNKVCINRSRNPKIIVSLTSYRKRFPTLKYFKSDFITGSFDFVFK